MRRPHVGEAGISNSAHHQAIAQANIDADSTGQLDNFRAMAHDSVPATNITAAKALAFDDLVAVVDGRTLQIHWHAGDRGAGLAAYRNAQRTFYVRRGAFEALWHGGDGFIYFSLNHDTAGTTAFGPFCIAIATSLDGHPDAAVFPADTAQRYTDSSGGINVTQVMSEVGDWTARGDIAVNELHTDVVPPPSTWPNLLCSKDRYLEIVVVGPVPLADVFELRLNRDDAKTLNRLSRQQRRGDLSDPTDIAAALAYQAIRRWRGTRLRIV